MASIYFGNVYDIQVYVCIYFSSTSLKRQILSTAKCIIIGTPEGGNRRKTALFENNGFQAISHKSIKDAIYFRRSLIFQIWPLSDFSCSQTSIILTGKDFSNNAEILFFWYCGMLVNFFTRHIIRFLSFHSQILHRLFTREIQIESEINSMVVCISTTYDNYHYNYNILQEKVLKY